jgi:hypothetical protein
MASKIVSFFIGVDIGDGAEGLNEIARGVLESKVWMEIWRKLSPATQ